MTDLWMTKDEVVKLALSAVVIFLLTGCGNSDSLDPTERRLSYVATAIIVAAIIGLFR